MSEVNIKKICSDILCDLPAHRFEDNASKFKSPRYKDCLDRQSELHKNIAEILGDKRALMDEYEIRENESAACQIDIAYMIGLKDGLEL